MFNDKMPCSNDGSKRKFTSLLVAGQGVLTAVAPGISVSFVRKMIGKNFENADELEARPAYRRQLRAIGIGTAAAGIAGYAMQVASEGSDNDDDEPATESA